MVEERRNTDVHYVKEYLFVDQIYLKAHIYKVHKKQENHLLTTAEMNNQIDKEF